MRESPQKSNRRFDELDALRGIAAATVVIHHFILARGFLPAVAWANHFPFRVLWAGHEAVLLFFVLSGFVLTLPFRSGSVLNYKSFVIRRICRIYLPYLAALLIAVLGDAYLHGINRQNGWLEKSWSDPVTPGLIVQHVLFVGNYDWAQFNSAFWSLVYEMRVSLWMPFLALGIRYVGSKGAIVLALALSILTKPIALLFASFWPVDLSGHGYHGSETFYTLHYAAFFILGGVLAFHMDAVRERLSRLRTPSLMFMGVAALTLYCGGLGWKLPFYPKFLFQDQIDDWFTALGAMLFICLSLSVIPLRDALRRGTVHHLGKISYSLYLVHCTVLFVLLHFDWFWKGYLVSLFAYLGASLVLAEIFYRLVERPAMTLGSSLVGRKRLVPMSVEVPAHSISLNPAEQ